MTRQSKTELKWIPIDDIKERDDLPIHGGRKYDMAYATGDKNKDKEKSSFSNLIASIEELGLIQTIAVDSEHCILAGRRRLEAMKHAGYKEVPCQVLGAVDRTEAFTIMLHENIRRLNLSDTEAALMIDAFDEAKRELSQTGVVENSNLELNKTSVGDNEAVDLLEQYWSQKDTAATLGISEASVSRSKKIAKAIREIPKIANQTGATILRVASREVARKRILKGEIEEAPDYFKSGNFWYFNDRDPRYGIARYPHGVVPGQAIENLLWMYTDRGDLVVDPLCGGGTFLDVANTWERKCLAYDKVIIRDDIVYNDIWDGLPEECRGAKLIYLDPPYGFMVKDAYESMEDYFKFQDHIVKVSAETVAVGGYMAYIIMDYSNRDENGRRYGTGKSLIGEAYRALQDHPMLEFDASISVPIPSAGYRQVPFEDCKTEHTLAALNRIIWVARKVIE